MEGVGSVAGAAWFIVDGLTPNEVTSAVEMGKAGWLNEEGIKLVGGAEWLKIGWRV